MFPAPPRYQPQDPSIGPKFPPLQTPTLLFPPPQELKDVRDGQRILEKKGSAAVSPMAGCGVGDVGGGHGGVTGCPPSVPPTAEGSETPTAVGTAPRRPPAGEAAGAADPNPHPLWSEGGSEGGVGSPRGAQSL